VTTTKREETAHSAAALSGNAAMDVYLQPHSDDVCFSLGALAHRRRAGNLLTVFSISSYVERPGKPLSPEEVTTIRKAEDTAFAAACGLKARFLDLKCCSILRRGAFDLGWVGENARRTETALLGALLALAERVPGRRPWLFSPSGIGGHVDHLAVRMVIVRHFERLSALYRVGFYEDLPYASEPYAPGGRLRQLGLDRLVAGLPGRKLIRHVQPLGDAVETKLALIRLYASQFAETPASLDRFTPATRAEDPPHEAIWSDEPTLYPRSDEQASSRALPTELHNSDTKARRRPSERAVRPTGSGSPGIALAMPAVAPSRGISGMVSVITPTHGRDRFLNEALRYFRSQDYENIEWLILDDSPQRTGSLNGIEDRNIFYQHVEGKVSIGEKRNALIEKARGEIIVQFDDDDYYAPNYISSMLTALAERDADLVNLRGWFLYDLRSDCFGYWDLMQKEGPHFRCDRTGVAPITFTPENNQALENVHFGYGFSYVFKKKVWEAEKFPARDWNEDGEFSLKARAKFKVTGVHDTTGLCLHFLHPGSTSRCFPQHYIPKFLFQRLFPVFDELSSTLRSDFPSDAVQWHYERLSPSEVGRPSQSSSSSAITSQIHLINLDRSTERLATFKAWNPHLENIIRVSAIDGALANREELVKDGTITEDLPYPNGALGCALSHVSLWKKAVAEHRSITVFEDDVICAHHFPSESARIVASLPVDWDIIMWAFNFQPLFLWLDYGFSKANLRFYDRRAPEDYRKFQSAKLSSTAVRLAHSFGCMAYSVSAKGARALLAHCLPLRKRLIEFPGAGVGVRDQGIDTAMNLAYSSMQAFVCIPPLVIHDDSQLSDRIATDRG